MLKMNAVIDGVMNGKPIKDFKVYKNGLTFGGFCFTCKINGENKDVNFDWDSYAGKIQKDGTLLLMEGEDGLFPGTGELDDIYDAEYEENGFLRSDLTAKLLSETTNIKEFCIDYDDASEDDYFHIKSITFIDDIGSYSVSGDILDKFNGLTIYEEIQPVGDLGVYDKYDESLMDYPIEINTNQNNDTFDIDEELPF